MAALFKAVKSPIHRPFSFSSSKHQKLPDKWGDYQHKDKVQDGITFNVKYLGSTLVTELDEEGQSYGDSISAEAVNTVVNMAKVSGKKLPKMSIFVSPKGIRVTNLETQDVLTDLDIYRICFCTADREHGKVFAFIARNRENETMECQAFLCPKRKIAQAVTLTVNESFQLAKEQCEEEERVKKAKQMEKDSSSDLIHQRSQHPDELTTARTNCTTIHSAVAGFDDNFVDIQFHSEPRNNLKFNSTDRPNLTISVGRMNQNTCQSFLSSPDSESGEFSRNSPDDLLSL
jgi:low density lipoprotein receptor adapter protein 1